MNKRIRKKRAKRANIYIGDRMYTREELKIHHMVIIARGLITLYSQIKNPKIIKPRVKALVNYIYKDRTKKYQHLSYKHLKFARHLKPKPEFIMSNTSTMPKVIAGGKTMKYNSSTFIQFGGNNNGTENME